MRQAKKEIKDYAVITGLLEKCHVGRLGTNGSEGYPIIKPVNFAYYKENIYFHTALEGEKIGDIKRDSRVCFEVDLPIALVKSKGEPCRADYYYRSVIIKGKARLVEDRSEQRFGLKLLLQKYQPEGGYGEFLEQKLRITGIVRIDIEQMTGKEDLGKGEQRETVLKALESGVPLPIVLERE